MPVIKTALKDQTESEYNVHPAFFAHKNKTHECLLTSLGKEKKRSTAAALHLLWNSQIRRRTKCHRVWVHNIIRRCTQLAGFHLLLRELSGRLPLPEADRFPVFPFIRVFLLILYLAVRINAFAFVLNAPLSCQALTGLTVCTFS